MGSLAKFYLVLSICFITSCTLFAQTTLALLDSLDYNVGLNDIWGYADGSGNEYALVGLVNGVSIVDISTNPTVLNEVQFIPGVNSNWRDIKTKGNYAYVTNESSGGLQIIDLSNLPGAVTVSYYTGGGLTTAHNIFIDENGYAYLFGSNIGVGGAVILDLTNPTAPVQLGNWNGKYLHDGMVRGDTLWGAAIYAGVFEVVDVSNKTAPVTFGATHPTPNAFTHNCWISDDGNTLFTTDERNGAYIGAYDVSDLSNISETDRIKTSTNVSIPHNTHTLNDYQIVSWYNDGVVIIDGNEPEILVEVGSYDTYPQGAGTGFAGAWGAYPYFASGKIAVSDRQNGLHVFDVSYVRASYLNGNVTDSTTGGFLNNVAVIIQGPNESATTNLIGDYKMGIAAAGMYSVTYSLAGYYPKTINNVSLTAGVFTNLNVQLVPYPDCPNIIINNDVPIAAGEYQAVSVVQSQGLVPSGKQVKFKAKDAIDLLNDFEIELGGEFEAIIDTCQ